MSKKSSLYLFLILIGIVVLTQIDLLFGYPLPLFIVDYFGDTAIDIIGIFCLLLGIYFGYDFLTQANAGKEGWVQTPN